MHQRHNRTVTIQKGKLITTIKANKANHIKEYKEAVIAYRIEAAKQLDVQKKRLADGELNIHINLTTPVNRAEEYDKVIEMFTWEVNAKIELTQSEFNEYVHDENDSSRSAKFANSFYLSSNR